MIAGTIKTRKKFKFDQKAAIENVMEEFSLSEEDAINYVKKYWQFESCIFHKEDVRKGIGDIMGGKVLEMESEKLKAEGEARGEAIGQIQGEA